MEAEKGYSYLAEMAAKAHKDKMGKFKGFIVEGDLRVGKTSYSIKVMRDVHMILNPSLSIDEAYEKALENMHFNLEPFLDLVSEKQREIKAMLPKVDWSRRIPVATLDDGSLYAGAGLFFTNQKLYSAFQNAMTTIGTAVSAIIITVPKVQALTKPLREFYNYHPVTVRVYSPYQREAVIREWYTAKSGRLKKRKLYVDVFSPRIPTSHYAKYLRKRIELGEDSVKQLREAIEEGQLSEEVAAEAIQNIPDFNVLREELRDVQKRLQRRKQAIEA